MGSPLCSIVAILFMESLEEPAVDFCPQNFRYYFKCVDTFVVWPRGFKSLQHFVNPLNLFIVEVEKEGKLSFLVWHHLRTHGLSQATHMNRNLNALFHYLPAQNN